MPSRAAASFMRPTNASVLPATASASMTATSLADWTMSTLSPVSTVICPPTGGHSFLRAGDLRVRLDFPRLQRLEGDIGGHQLGQRGREPLHVGVFGIEHRAVDRLEHESGPRAGDRWSDEQRPNE